MKQLISWLKAHPVVSRALHTFWQTFLATFIVGAGTVMNALMSGDVDTARLGLISLAAASLATALSALKTYIVEQLKEND